MPFFGGLVIQKWTKDGVSGPRKSINEKSRLPVLKETFLLIWKKGENQKHVEGAGNLKKKFLITYTHTHSNWSVKDVYRWELLSVRSSWSECFLLFITTGRPRGGNIPAESYTASLLSFLQPSKWTFYILLHFMTFFLPLVYSKLTDSLWAGQMEVSTFFRLTYILTKRLKSFNRLSIRLFLYLKSAVST